MARRRKDNTEVTKLLISAEIFMESYNQSIPAGFPHVSLTALHEFQLAHPALFKHGKKWSIDRHRKRLMDWLLTHHNAI